MNRHHREPRNAEHSSEGVPPLDSAAGSSGGVPAVAYAAALLVLTFAAYFPALSGSYLWTDASNVGAIKEHATLAELWSYWSSTKTEQYFPLTYSSFWLERLAWGARPMPSHAINIFLHFLNACIFVSVLRRLGVPGAWFAAAVFALHPVHVESVAWIIERKNVLSVAFFLLTLLFYLRSECESSGRGYFRSLAFFTLALLAKTSTVVLPVGLVLCRLYLRRTWSRRDVARLVPFVAMSCLMIVVTITFDHEKNPFLDHELRTGLGERLAIAGLNVWFYLGKLIAPMQLTFIYEQWDIDLQSAVAFLPALCVLATGAALWALRYRGGYGPLLVFAFYLAGLFPVIGFFLFYYMTISPVADRFQYLPSLAPIALFAAAGCRWPNWGERFSERRASILRCCGALCVLAVLGILTWQQCHSYRDGYTMWQDTLRKAPEARSAHRLLGRAAARQGDTKTARFHYRKEIKLHPQERKAYFDLALLQKGLGNTKAVEATYRAAIDANPRFPGAHILLGDFYRDLGRPKKAIESYQRALQVPFVRKPERIHFRLAQILNELGRDAEAKMHLRKSSEPGS